MRAIRMPDLTPIVDGHRPDFARYETLYKHLHANPELSQQEHETADTIAKWLAEFSEYTVHTAIGGGTGIAAVFENGDGPTILLRADIDGLPVEEKTGLEYASKKKMPDLEGKEKPVMHACGHDMHVTGLLAAAELLAKAKESWRGTLILIFQPAEEKGTGAQQMVDAGLYDLIPKPDVAIGGHVFPLRSGSIGTRRGLMGRAADSFHLTIPGRQGHASQPHRTIDPIVQAASTILRLQTIVSREVAPDDPVVVTVSAIHAGEAENIIPDKAELKINVRNVDNGSRKRVLDSVQRIINAEAKASDAEELPVLRTTSSFPLMINDPEATARIEEHFTRHFGAGPHAYDATTAQLPGSEDFGIFASAIDRPAVFFVYGGVDPKFWDEKEAAGRINQDVPSNHSPFFAPVIQPTLQVAVDGYALSALTWLAV